MQDQAPGPGHSATSGPTIDLANDLDQPAAGVGDIPDYWKHGDDSQGLKERVRQCWEQISLASTDGFSAVAFLLSGASIQNSERKVIAGHRTREEKMYKTATDASFSKLKSVYNELRKAYTLRATILDTNNQLVQQRQESSKGSSRASASSRAQLTRSQADLTAEMIRQDEIIKELMAEKFKIPTDIKDVIENAKVYTTFIESYEDFLIPALAVLEHKADSST